MKKSLIVLNVLAVATAAGIAIEALRARPPAAPQSSPVVGSLVQAMVSAPESDSTEDVVLTGAPTSGATAAQVRVAWVEQSRDEMAVRGELRVYAGRTQPPVQTIGIKLEGALPREEMSFEFSDLTGDGFADLVFTHSGRFRGMTESNVYIWAPKRGAFVKSETLSGIRLSTEPTRPGCVKQAFNCTSNTYSESEMCFNQSTGRWRTVSTSACQER
jgi:hypothetical protein